jgi:excisionase family DNA binding protein
MKPLLNSKAVCQLLGISPAVLSRWVHANKIPYVQLTAGKKKLVVRFKENELEAWLDRRSRGAVPKPPANLSRDDHALEVKDQRR